MALNIASAAPTLLLRRAAYESSGIARAAIDERLGLTPDEFRVEGDLVAIGPLHGAAGDALGEFVADLEQLGLVYFDDFFELSGSWPEWLRVFASGSKG
jgi:hypothetical protein